MSSVLVMFAFHTQCKIHNLEFMSSVSITSLQGKAEKQSSLQFKREKESMLVPV